MSQRTSFASGTTPGSICILLDCDFDGPPAIEDTQWMLDRYPEDIRKWLAAMGGIKKMPYEGYWTLYATLLGAMGHRRRGVATDPDARLSKPRYGDHHQQPQKDCRYDEPNPFPMSVQANAAVTPDRLLSTDASSTRPAGCYPAGP
jgi:hypothetical protein